MQENTDICKQTGDLTDFDTAWREMTTASSILITSHIRADGDSLGSVMAVWFALKEGRNADILIDSDIPYVYASLPGIEQVRKPGAADTTQWDLVVSLDTATKDRLGDVARLTEGCRIVNIDHHPSNSAYGDVNLIRPTASSTGEIIHQMLKWAGCAITPEIAEALYTAILTDTGRFLYFNTTSSALRAAAELVDAGARPEIIGARIYKSNTLPLIKLRALALSTLRLYEEGRVAVMEITREMFRETGTRPIDTQIFVDIPAGIDGVEVAMMIRDADREDTVKASLRSKGYVNVNQIASEFGGGGHSEAAGCELPGPMETVAERLLEVIRRHLKAADEKHRR
ncbi:MAG TPA: bifunctional oligoribonuclease/PAP phosphatase NrnA [Candidatus Brocadiia bacterium]|nr:bifunctional oligoribonuclease/PAP phosphatase NrnA [Candidatus Brocadiia bacterium]